MAADRSELYEEIMERAPVCGLSAKQVDRSFLQAEAFGADYNYWSYPMLRGHLTGSPLARGSRTLSCRPMPVPMIDLCRDKAQLAEIEAAVVKVVRSGQYVLGPEVEKRSFQR